ncbi:hypothetical protein ACH40E_28530 [Streptomyces acidicola]|uniref:hypothetical protein n=1 Tax=Streptomyces acidicola TaxID=2596892 RepID=UPI0037905119
MSAVSSCGQAYQARDEQGLELLLNVAASLAQVEEAVLRAHRTRGVVRARSHRRRALKEHAARVATRLRAAEAQLAVDGAAALPEVAELLLTVTERYLEGKVGNLLDKDELDKLDNEFVDVEPVRDHRQSLRLITFVISFVLLAAAGAFGAESLGLPGAVEPIVIGTAGVIAAVLAYGKQPGKALEWLPFFGG